LVASSESALEITMQTNTFLPAEVWGENPIVVDAVANTLGNKLCVLSLQQTDKNALALSGLARVNAPGCAVQSNSNDPSGLTYIAQRVLAT